MALHSIRGGVMGGDEYRVMNVPRVSVYRNAGTIPADSTPYTVSWDVQEYDTDNMWDPADPTKLTARTPAVYLVHGWGQWAANSTVTRRMALKKVDVAGNVYIYFNPGDEIPAVGAGLATTQQVSFPVPLNKGDYVILVVTQFTAAGGLAWTGATLKLRTNGFTAHFLSTLG